MTVDFNDYFWVSFWHLVIFCCLKWILLWLTTRWGKYLSFTNEIHISFFWYLPNDTWNWQEIQLPSQNPSFIPPTHTKKNVKVQLTKDDVGTVYHPLQKRAFVAEWLTLSFIIDCCRRRSHFACYLKIASPLNRIEWKCGACEGLFFGSVLDRVNRCDNYLIAPYSPWMCFKVFPVQL
mgnify:CR=1 FL=1